MVLDEALLLTVLGLILRCYQRLVRADSEVVLVVGHAKLGQGGGAAVGTVNHQNEVFRVDRVCGGVSVVFDHKV